MPRHVLPPSRPADPGFVPTGQGLVRDAATGLVWPVSANLLGFPVTWAEALEAVAGWRRDVLLGRSDWRLPNRRELRSLLDHGAKNPALPPGHPFQDVFLGWYWASTTKAGRPDYAWSVHMEGARTFYGHKTDYRLVWPVAGQSLVLPSTGQTLCYDASGMEIACAGTGQDGESRCGVAWPEPRFERAADGMADRLTGLVWADSTSTGWGRLVWDEALALPARLGPGWRLPDINELESLVDAAAWDPALPPELAALVGPVWPEGWWSATVSGYDPAYAFVLYGGKAAVGVGFKAGRDFAAWPVRDEDASGGRGGARE